MEQHNNLRTAASYTAAYVLWGVSLVASVLVGLLLQQALIQIIAIISVLGAADDPIALSNAAARVRAGNAWSYLLLGLLLVVVVVLLEHWYRTGVSSGRLLLRFLLATTIQLGVLFLAHGLYFVTASLAGLISWHGVYLPVVELAATALGAYLYSRWARRLRERCSR